MPMNRLVNKLETAFNKVNKYTNYNIIILSFIFLLIIFQSTTYVKDLRDDRLASAPVTDWFKVTEFHIPDIVEGTNPEDVVINYQREIYTDLDGTWNARVKFYYVSNGNFIDICGSGGGVGYNPKAKLPEPVTWAWLMNDDDGECLSKLRANSTYINIITWVFKKDNYPDKSYRVVSNPYTILPK